MDETKRDYYESQQEKALISRTGKSRITRTDSATGQSGECVVVKPALPILPTLRDRLEYLRGKMTVKDFCEKHGVGIGTYYIMHGNKYPQRNRMQIAKSLEVPAKWLFPGLLEKAEKEKAPEQPKSYMQIAVHGEKDKDELVAILEMLPQGRQFYVDIEIKGIL